MIVPKNGRAVRTPAGPRAKVAGARRYHASRALTQAVQRAKPLMEEPTKKALLDAYRKAGLDVSG